MSTKKIEETTPMKKNTIPEETSPSAAVKERKPRKTVKTSPDESKTNEPEISPEGPAKKPRRGLWIFLGIIGILVIAAAGCLTGYGLGIRARQVEELNQRVTLATTQYVMSLQDIENGNLSMAKTRLEYVIKVYPEYPNAVEKLTEVMVTLSQNSQSATTPQTIATTAPTADIRSIEAMYASTQQQLAGQDWSGLLTTVNSIRNADPTYKSIKVDGLYYLALRNMAIAKINSGHLETGIYYLTLAGQIGPIDSEALGYESRAMIFLNAGAGFGVTWQRAVTGFETLYAMVPFMIDVNGVTVTQRYAQSLAGYGDSLQSTYEWCGAVEQYEKSLSIMNSDAVGGIIDDARAKCENPPATPTPSGTPTP
jgi:hypothetical protein